MWHEACARQIGSGGLIPDQQEGLLPLGATLGAWAQFAWWSVKHRLRLRAAGKVTEVALAGKVATRPRVAWRFEGMFQIKPC